MDKETRKIEWSIMLRKIHEETLPEDEERSFAEWIDSDPSHRSYFEKAKREWTQPATQPDNDFEELERLLLIQPFAIESEKIRRIERMWKYVAAAAVTLMLAVVSFNYFINVPDLNVEKTPVAENKIEKIDDIHFGETKAILKLANGERVQLSDTIIGSTGINKTNGKQSIDKVDKSSVKNLCLDVPRGGEFKIVLEDSTVVWLNSQTTLYYPESFSENERRVRLTGEAYFEVKKDDNRPFYVTTANQEVRVYGTTFNIRGYADEDAVLTTLESGSVSVFRTGDPKSSLMLTPGHQSRFDIADSELSVREADPKTITSWRYGKFVFEESTLAEIMRDLSRWYDFEYEFASPSLKEIVFMGSISRYSDFSKVVSVLEATGEIRVSVVDNKLRISKK